MADGSEGRATLLNGLSPFYRLNPYPLLSQTNFLPSLLQQSPNNTMMPSAMGDRKDGGGVHVNGSLHSNHQQDAPTPPALAPTVTQANSAGANYSSMNDGDSPSLNSAANDINENDSANHNNNNNAANAAAVAKSALLILSQPGAGRAQHVYVCSIPGELRHGQPIHLITASGQIFTTTVAQLTQDVRSVGGGASCSSPLSPTPTPQTGLSLPGQSNSTSHPLTSPSSFISTNKLSFASSSTQCKGELSPSDGQEQSVQKLLNASKDINMAHFARGKINAASSGAIKRRSLDEESLDGVSVDGINLEEIKEFAKAFKLKRLSLGLTQTQVGQALSMTEGPAYSQSAICRFEKLDITPKSAQKIKPVLEKWMGEVDEQVALGFLIPNVGPVTSHEYSSPSAFALIPPVNLSDLRLSMGTVGEGSSNGDSHPSAMSPATAALVSLSDANRKRKRRTSFTPQALDLLNQFFERNTHPTGAEMTALAESLGYDREVVRVWFCNKRQALKNTIKKLKHCHDSH